MVGLVNAAINPSCSSECMPVPAHLAAAAIARGEVAALAHEAGNDAVEGAALVPKAFLARAERAEVLSFYYFFLFFVFVFVFFLAREDGDDRGLVWTHA